MKHIKILTTIFTLLFTMTYTINSTMAQESSSYTMNLVKVIDHKKKNSVSVILKVSPTIEDFKLIVSGKIEYAFGRKKIKSNLQKDPNTQITVYGSDFYTKAPKLFKPIKGDIEMKENEILLVFTFSNIKGKNLAEGYLKYGLWESNNPDIRHEQIFEFDENEIIKN